MAEETKRDKLTLQELMVSTLATSDALAKLLIVKGIITTKNSKHSWVMCINTHLLPFWAHDAYRID